jgi:signal peptidase II
MPPTASPASPNLKKAGLKTFLSVLVLLVLDRVTKMYFLSRLLPGDSVPVTGDMVRFTLVANTGAAFGSLQESRLLLTVLSAIILAVLLWLLLSGRIGDRWTFAGITLMISGALGNLIDRLCFGHVIDFIDVDIPDILPRLPRWPVFNIADSCITAGIILVIAALVFRKEKRHVPGPA